jgi:hypothetical protein
MTRGNAVLAAILATALTGCQKPAPDPALQAENEALKKRLESLEQQPPAAQPSAVPLEGASPFAVPTPGAEPETRVEAGAASSRRATPAARPRTTPGRPAAAPAPAAEADPEARVERIRPAAEPMASANDPAPRREPLELEEGTELTLVLETALSSETAREGDPVVARVERATDKAGRTALPGGTVLKGKVYRAEQAGRVRGRAILAADFDRIVVRGREHRIDTTAILAEGPSGTKRDAAIVGGSTAAGAILGAIADGGKGARRGAIIGAVGGAGAVLATKGGDVQIPSGSRWTVQVKGTVLID